MTMNQEIYEHVRKVCINHPIGKYTMSDADDSYYTMIKIDECSERDDGHSRCFKKWHQCPMYRKEEPIKLEYVTTRKNKS